MDSFPRCSSSIKLVRGVLCNGIPVVRIGKFCHRFAEDPPLGGLQAPLFPALIVLYLVEDPLAHLGWRPDDIVCRQGVV